METQSQLEVRFLNKIHRNGPVPTQCPERGPCWLWTAHVDKDGYGIIWDNDIKENARAHRVSWRIHFGAIPDGLRVCHHCDNPPCTNPVHLFLGTNKDNSHDRDTKGRGADRRGEKHPRSKLTDEQALEIIELGSTGMNHGEIALQFGVVRSIVSRIINRTRWKHLSASGAGPLATSNPTP